ncbi:MAG: 2Fe-2S iron-sulfur cluster-binding protein [Cellvibrionaceae bacterium]
MKGSEGFRVVLILDPQADASKEFLIDSNTTLLQAMHEAQLPVRKACRNGGCGVCRCRLIEGEVDYRQREPFALWEKDKAEGIILPCIAYPASELVLDNLSFDQSRKGTVGQ